MTIADAEYAWLDSQTTGIGSISDLEWEYYSTRSGLTPIQNYTLAGHKYYFFKNQTGLLQGSIQDMEWVFYSSRSGLSPAQNFSIASHKLAFFGLPLQVYNITDLFSTNPFYIAHRGGGDDNAEHTMSSYSAAVAKGFKAIELSVQVTLDGQLVCFHDTTLARMCNGAAGAISDFNYSALPLVDARAQLGPNYPLLPIPKLNDVITAFQGKVVLFIEPKVTAATAPLQALIPTLPGYLTNIVWKSHYTAASLAWAKGQGIKTWAYLDPTTTSLQMDGVDVNVDYWGIPDPSLDAQVSMVVAHAPVKPAIMWEIHRRSQRDKQAGLGVRGMMTSSISYVRNTIAQFTQDNFSTGLAAPGNIPLTNNNFADTLRFDGDAVYLPNVPNKAALMGSMSPIPSQYYKIRFKMMWPVLPNVSEHSGIAFGKADDQVYAFGVVAATNGYHLVFRGDGDMQIYKHTAGSGAGTQLGDLQNTLPVMVAGQWMSFEIEVNATNVIARRLDTPGAPSVLSVANVEFRPALSYFHISTGSVTNVNASPRFKDIEVIPL